MIVFNVFIFIEKNEDAQDSDDSYDDEPELSMSENDEDEESVSSKNNIVMHCLKNDI